MFKRKFLFLGFFLFALVFQFSFFVPSGESLQAASLSLIPCGLNGGSNTENVPCTLCHLLVGIENVVTWMRNVMTAIAIAVIVGMAILYIVSTGNDSLMSTAKEGMKAALIGFALILSAWLIVNVVFNLPIFNGATGLIRTNWYTFSCNLASNVISTTSTPQQKSVTSTTGGSVVPPPTGPPIVSTNPSTGVTLSAPNSQVYPGDRMTLTLSGSLNTNAGPFKFTYDTSAFSIQETSTTTTTLTVLSTARPGVYPVQVLQGGTLLNTINITVLGLPFNPGTDPGGPISGGGGGGGGGSCPSTDPNGIPYNDSLPLAPLMGWSASDLFAYWQSLPDASTSCGWKSFARYAMYAQNTSMTNGNAFVGLVDTNFFAGDTTARATWINGTATCGGSGTSFNLGTGIATYTAPGGSIVNLYPGSGIPRTAACTGGGSGGGAVQDFCGQFGGAAEFPLAWGDGKRYYIKPWPSGVVIVKFTVPSPPTNYSTAGHASLFEFQGPPSLRIMSLSRSKCDFRPTDPTGANGPFDASGGVTPAIIFSVGTPGILSLPPGDYYLNMANAPATFPASTACPQASCNAGYEIIWPHN